MPSEQRPKVPMTAARIRQLIDGAEHGTQKREGLEALLREQLWRRPRGRQWEAAAAAAKDAATETKMTKMTKEAVVTTVATAGQRIDCSAGENVA